MPDRDPRLVRLVRLAELIRDRDLGACRAAIAREDRIARQIAATTSQPIDLPEWQGDPRPALAYNRWCDDRRALLNVELARARAESAALKQAAQRALGRHDVLTQIADRGHPTRNRP
ncbi:hypothetical protein E7811_08010 [Aliigemmobacter aestuarii]|uniref:Flagellar export protein FliJ n=1 Tax=Aliigemmobacter aestuarii TaxID=1445661 RepID=A0A4V3V0X4_9RHOB|nr:hypothetical protein [Gemmobacter aestuarii]THD85622.1 hypothetical protein E7811_08010 [Gemmobacter aestuarii]